METGFTVAVTGDAIINRRLSVCREQGFLSLVKILRDTDVAYTHFETLVHDFEGPELYPAAEAGWTWMRSPRFVPDELKWAGFDMVSHASNHCLDYAYGGLLATWKALEASGLPYAGTGRHLGEAREPAYLETANGRVALISMCSSFVPWTRAGETRRDVKGRPGLNPLRFHYQVDAETLETLKRLAIQLGWWVTQIDQQWLFNPAGLHNTVYRFVEADEPGLHAVVDEVDAAGNIRSIRDASRQADCVIVHLHTHEWDPDKGLSAPAEFVPPFARACIDAGANVFVAEGSHAPLRGIEIYQHKPIFYDPGDFFRMSDTVTRLPADFYGRPGYEAEVRSWEATPSDAFEARRTLPLPLNPPGGYMTAPVIGCVIGVCAFEAHGTLAELKLYPATLFHQPQSLRGIPHLAEGETAEKMIAYLAALSAPFGTTIECKDGIGLVKL